ncbi:MAG TPA: hypothetical protein VFA39_10855 [Steroidobacteraceae bacterium]|nr:hypothetical protein [Steroidobacteraceae bacterium]
MSYKREAEAQLSHPPDHITRPTPFPANASQRMIPRRATGWDPYEVWRTRVKKRPDHEGEALDKVG